MQINGVQVMYDEVKGKDMYRAVYWDHRTLISKDWTENAMVALDDFVYLRETAKQEYKKERDKI